MKNTSEKKTYVLTKNGGYIIELCGLSGAGKTTLSKLLQLELDKKELSFELFTGKSLLGREQSKYLLMKNIIIFFLCRPLIFLKVTFTLTKNIYRGNQVYGKSSLKREVIVKWIVRWMMFIDSIIKLRGKNKLCILDRGICTNLMSIITRVDICKLDLMLEKLLYKDILPDFLIEIKIDHDSLVKRRKERGDVKKIWQRDFCFEKKQHERILSCISNICTTKNKNVVSLDATDPVQVSKIISGICAEFQRL